MTIDKPPVSDTDPVRRVQSKIPKHPSQIIISISNQLHTHPTSPISSIPAVGHLRESCVCAGAHHWPLGPMFRGELGAGLWGAA